MVKLLEVKTDWGGDLFGGLLRLVYRLVIRWNTIKKEVSFMAKTANVLARVEPDVKEEAESILNELGVPASVVINMLYKQIIYTRGIPFALTLNHEPVSREEMTDREFDSMIETGLTQAKAGKGRSTADVAKDLKKKIKGWK